jgi:hypothetical protein
MLEVMELEHRIMPSGVMGIIGHSGTIQLQSPVAIANNKINQVMATGEDYEQWQQQLAQNPNAPQGLVQTIQHEILAAGGLLGQAKAKLYAANLNAQAANGSTLPENIAFFSQRYQAALAEANRLIGLAQQAIQNAEAYLSEAQTTADNVIGHGSQSSSGSGSSDSVGLGSSVVVAYGSGSGSSGGSYV